MTASPSATSIGFKRCPTSKTCMQPCCNSLQVSPAAVRHPCLSFSPPISSSVVICSSVFSEESFFALLQAVKTKNPNDNTTTFFISLNLCVLLMFKVIKKQKQF